MTDFPALPSHLALEKGRPLIVCDADEVLFYFMRGLERYLAGEGYTMNLRSFAITGNVIDAETGEAATGERVKALLDSFFACETRGLDPVEGAAAALAALSPDAQVVILSNLPAAQAEDRRHCLVRHGMDYPLMTHSGLKGPMVRRLMDAAGAPAVFIDDLPPHIDSVAAEAPGAACIHFVADERLARIVPTPTGAHERAHDWAGIHGLIARALDL